MAGHSKWANIKHRKAAQDKRRGKKFTKFIREITVSARLGGGDPLNNPRLALAMDKAFGDNMPKDTIERAIKRGVGDDDTADYEEIVYEGYGPGGVAVMVFCLSDNRNRTAADVRHAFSKFGGNLGAHGCVGYLFEKMGVLFVPEATEEQLFELALNAGAIDVIADEEGVELRTPAPALAAVRDALVAAGFEPAVAEVRHVPETTAVLDEDTQDTLDHFLEFLDDLDDVQEICTNRAD